MTGLLVYRRPGDSNSPYNSVCLSYPFYTDGILWSFGMSSKTPVKTSMSERFRVSYAASDEKKIFDQNL